MVDVQVTVYDVSRGQSSRMGNPSYIFNTDHGHYRTEADSGAAYGLENDFSVGTTLNVKVTLTLTSAGRVRDWKVEK